MLGTVNYPFNIGGYSIEFSLLSVRTSLELLSWVIILSKTSNWFKTARQGKGLLTQGKNVLVEVMFVKKVLIF